MAIHSLRAARRRLRWSRRRATLFTLTTSILLWALIGYAIFYIVTGD